MFGFRSLFSLLPFILFSLFVQPCLSQELVEPKADPMQELIQELEDYWMNWMVPLKADAEKREKELKHFQESYNKLLEEQKNSQAKSMREREYLKTSLIARKRELERIKVLNYVLIGCSVISVTTNVVLITLR